MSHSQSPGEAPKEKQGRIEVRAGEALVFVEDPHTGTIDKPPEALRRAASQVGDAIRAYRESAKELLNNRYPEIRELAPSHLREPCNTTVICCSNGVVVRYDRGVEGETKLRAGASSATLTELAPKISDFLIHFPEDRDAYDPGPGGVFLQFMKVNSENEAVEELSTARIIVLASPDLPEGITPLPPPARPPCLVSLTNELQLELGGIVVPADPASAGNIDRTREFLARGTMQLQVGWLAFEVYPAFQAEYWKPEFAPVWAENDLLAAVARRQFSQIQVAALDPNAGARREFKLVLEQLQELLHGPEEPAHQFLRQHAEVLCPANTGAWSKLPIGNRVTDFVFRQPDNDYLLVEIESPLRRLFRKDGQPRHELTHAFNQILDWRVFLEDNLRRVQEELGLVGISANPSSLIVIGRAATLTEEDRRKLTTLQNQIPRLRILTYDDLIESSKAIGENLFGPLDMIGENLEIYYLPSGTVVPEHGMPSS